MQFLTNSSFLLGELCVIDYLEGYMFYTDIIFSNFLDIFHISFSLLNLNSKEANERIDWYCVFAQWTAMDVYQYDNEMCKTFNDINGRLYILQLHVYELWLFTPLKAIFQWKVMKYFLSWRKNNKNTLDSRTYKSS